MVTKVLVFLQNRDEHLEQIRRKAESENQKVNEVAFISTIKYAFDMMCCAAVLTVLAWR